MFPKSIAVIALFILAQTILPAATTPVGLDQDIKRGMYLFILVLVIFLLTIPLLFLEITALNDNGNHANKAILTGRAHPSTLQSHYQQAT